jgi:hypothetical protein
VQGDQRHDNRNNSEDCRRGERRGSVREDGPGPPSGKTMEPSHDRRQRYSHHQRWQERRHARG